jgi:hypothetical protein
MSQSHLTDDPQCGETKGGNPRPDSGTARTNFTELSFPYVAAGAAFCKVERDWSIGDHVDI